MKLGEELRQVGGRRRARRPSRATAREASSRPSRSRPRPCRRRRSRPPSAGRFPSASRSSRRSPRGSSSRWRDSARATSSKEPNRPLSAGIGFALSQPPSAYSKKSSHGVAAVSKLAGSIGRAGAAGAAAGAATALRERARNGGRRAARDAWNLLVRSGRYAETCRWRNEADASRPEGSLVPWRRRTGGRRDRPRGSREGGGCPPRRGRGGAARPARRSAAVKPDSEGPKLPTGEGIAAETTAAERSASATPAGETSI